MKPTVLEDLKIASPCAASWDEMKGDDRKRFCDQCSLHVYDLSGLERKAAESLVEHSEGRLCVRMFVRKDGTVMTKDCPVGFAKVKRRMRKVAAALFALLSLGACSSGEKVGPLEGKGNAATTVPTHTTTGPEEEMMLVQGDVCIPEEHQVEPMEQPRPLMGRPMVPPKPGK